jgi:UDP-GlcNAc:undecaprenyl-phosphate GlcNAc-1-phosphate transferase
MVEQYAFLIVAASALAANLLFTPLILYLAHHHEWYDEKNHRKIHTEDVPRLGGVGFFMAIVVATIVGLVLVRNGTLELGPTLLRLLPVLLGLAVMHGIGLTDDFANLRAVYKFILQLVGAALVTLGPFQVGNFIVPFSQISISLGPFAYPFTVIWIVAITNAVNLIDGLDGLAGGVAAIAALSVGLIGVFILGNPLLSTIAFAMFGALLAFLIFNLPPARIFMGDCGSLTLGFLLAVLPLIPARVDAAATGLVSSATLGLIPMITVLLVPILDTVTAIGRRIRARKPVHQADREHIHHKLMDAGLSNTQILLIVYGFTGLMGASAAAWFLMPRTVGILVILVIWLVSLAAVLSLNGHEHRHLGGHRPFTPRA